MKVPPFNFLEICPSLCIPITLNKLILLFNNIIGQPEEP